MLNTTCKSLGMEWCESEALDLTIKDIQNQFFVHGSTSPRSCATRGEGLKLPP
jgi:hypothetical protein